MENKIDHIIARVLTGGASSEDIFFLSNWLNKNEWNKKTFLQIKGYWDAEISFHQSISPNLAIEKLRQKINRQEKKIKQKQAWLIFTPVAATIALLITVASLLFTDKKEDIVAAQQYYTYLTDKNRSDIVLNDGTKITLNKNSRLTYSDTYGKGHRTVKLEGEAYFEVTKDTANPFEVQIEDAEIIVLGTTFSVESNRQSNQITATLVEGSIRFESPNQQVMLTPNQQLVFNRSTSQIAVRAIDADKEIAWKDGLLKYHSVTLTHLLEDMEKQYNVQIILNNKKLKDPSITLSGTFSQDQSLEQILQVVSRSLPVQWTVKNGVYYVK